MQIKAMRYHFKTTVRFVIIKSLITPSIGDVGHSNMASRNVNLFNDFGV